MKKYLAVIIPFFVIISSSFSDYNIKYPIEASKGGNLPNGSINFKTIGSGNGEPQIPTEFTYSCSFRATNSSGSQIPSVFTGTCTNGVLTGKLGPSNIVDGLCSYDRNVSFRVGVTIAPTQYCPES